MNIDNLTFGELKQIATMFGGNKQVEESPFEIGKAYLFRTVTHIDIGRVTAIKGKFVMLDDASWVADTGRYHDCLKSGDINEYESYPDGNGLNTTALIDFCEWNHELPKGQK